MNWTLLTNSLLVAGAATLLAAALGLAVALALASVWRTVRAGLLALCVAVLVLPSFLVTNSWIDLLGVNGALRHWLPLEIYSLPGAVWILALLLWPVSALGIFSAWQKLDAAHLELDPGLRGASLLRFLLLPAAKSALVISAVITFALALNNFAVPAILQVKVFPAEVWVQFSTNLNAAAAFRLSWPLILGPVLLIFFLRREAVPWPRESASDIGVQLAQQLGPLWLGVSRATGALALVLSLAVPLAQIVFHARTWSEFLPALAAGQSALWHSVFYAATAAVVTVAIGVLLMRRRGLGWLWIFFLIPGVLLGVGAATVGTHPTLFWFSRTSAIVIALLVVRYLAVAHSLARSAHQSLDQNLIDAARVNGAAGFTLFRHAVLPQMAGPLAGAGYVVFVLSLWDVETTLLVLPPGVETLAVRVFNLLHYGHNAQVNALCLILLLVALAPLGIFALWKAVQR